MNAVRCLVAMTIAGLIGNVLFEKLQRGSVVKGVALTALHAAENSRTGPRVLEPSNTISRLQTNLTRNLSLLEQFCAYPSESLAQELLKSKGIVPHLEAEDRIVVTKHERDWLTIFFQRGVEDEKWGVVTISPSGYLHCLRGDQCLWGADELDPVGMLWLDGSSSPFLTLLERDGGSGGFEETLRFFRLEKDDWIESGSIPLSYVWRSGDFPELCGADTPCRQRKADLAVSGSQIVLAGAEQYCRRLSRSKHAIQFERRSSTFQETYAFANGSFRKIRTVRSPLKREQELIAINAGSN
jgi:hypothetical protein